LQYDPVDIIFNATEELNGNSGLQSQATALLEALQIPYTGSSSLTLALCQDKIKTKKFLTYHSIPTPRWDYAYLPEHTINSELTYPLIIKPGVRDSNYNASKISILKRKEQLSAKLHELLAEHEEPALVEEC
jgi:D-alanine-D-alanine ligase